MSLFRMESRSMNKKIEPKLIAPIAGFTAALVEIVTIWPAEWCKTQAQLNRTNPNFSAVKAMMQAGPFGVYRSLTPLLIGAPLQGLIRFTSLDYFNNFFKEHKITSSGSSALSGLAAGITAGLLESVLVVTPMETVKTILVDSKQGIISGVKQVVSQHGIKGLYKGVSATASKSASNQALRFVIFNEYKDLTTKDRLNKELSAMESLLGGMLAGFLGAIGNTPFDTIKSRMQGLEASRYRSMFHCAQRMVLEEGPASLYKGLVFRWGRVIPGQGIIFLSYDVVSQKLRGISIPGPGGALPSKPKLNRFGSIGAEN